MNFSLMSKGEPGYDKAMMTKHIQSSRRWGNNLYTEPQQPKPLQKNQKAVSYIMTPVTHNLSPPYNEDKRMKKYCRDQLDESLIDLKKKKELELMQERRNRKLMAQQNGVLDYLQRQIDKRNSFIEGCWQKQQKMNNYYIDSDRVKHHKILQHINLNYDMDVFNHNSDKYKKMQRTNESKVSETNSALKEIKKYEKVQQRRTYGQYLDEKSTKDRHNPITNPIQYHIENPYLQARISRYS